MYAMIFIFTLVVVLAAFIFSVLIFILKSKPISSRIIEIIGYGLLVISIIWTGIDKMMGEFASSADKFNVDEKLHILWLYEGVKNEYLNTNDVENLTQDYHKLDEHWHGPAFDFELLKKQDTIVKVISYSLFVLSTLFIAAGRLGEIINLKNKVNKKVPHRKSSKDRAKKKISG